MKIIKKIVIFSAPLMLIAHLTHADPIPPENQTIIDGLISKYQSQCNAEQANFRGIDDDLDAPLVGVLTLQEDNIYQIEIDTSGKQATVLYPEFHCTNVGWGWCGTGGCGFYIVVDGVLFQRQVSFAPQSITVPTPIGERKLIIYPLHGTGCKTANQQQGYGSDPCYATASWSERSKTFYSRDTGFQLFEEDAP